MMLFQDGIGFLQTTGCPTGNAKHHTGQEWNHCVRVMIRFVDGRLNVPLELLERVVQRCW